MYRMYIKSTCWHFCYVSRKAVRRKVIILKCKYRLLLKTTKQVDFISFLLLVLRKEFLYCFVYYPGLLLCIGVYFVYRQEPIWFEILHLNNSLWRSVLWQCALRFRIWTLFVKKKKKKVFLAHLLVKTSTMLEARGAKPVSCSSWLFTQPGAGVIQFELLCPCSCGSSRVVIQMVLLLIACI